MLLDALGAMNIHQKIKVGSKNRYFFLGTISEFCGHMGEYNTIMKDTALKSYVKAEKKRNRKFEHPPTLTSFIFNAMKEPNPELSVDAYNRLVEKWFCDCLEAESFYKKTKEAYEGYVDLPERMVVDVRDSEYDRDTKIVLVEGNEIGLFWDFSEVGDSPFGIVGGESNEPVRQDS